ncbi:MULTISPECIES: phage structural protein [Bacteria]|uniref:Tail tube protein n=2 Tax=Seunavirus TaxID=1914851 RepID=V5KSX1_9CAUD|nr:MULTISPECIES: phage protein [Bacteria]YP_006987048.1 virion structural protein [Cronobacter phage vB_CsaM_GAP31]YP_008857274.1 virion structural protein [Escherichia phage 4MG]AFC21393.1 structural protein [Cronobacter phage vB_CsaM_GAP31]AGZ17532.1 tail tube protein [Escherichia phage 4MG]MBL5840855.1 DUF3277 family protein [Enterobacter asburiae]MCC3722181.1 DUF3277 family protein [Staphylococcus haemolyticus]
MNTAILTPYAYDPKKVKLYLMTQRVTGFAADTKIVVARNEDNIIPHMGVDGELSAALSRNQSGVMTVSLQNTASWNGNFANWQKQASITGLIFFPVLLEGSQGMGLSTIGWIQKQPDLTYGTEVGQMDWEIGILDAWLSPDTLSSAGFGLAGLAGIV